MFVRGRQKPEKQEKCIVFLHKLKPSIAVPHSLDVVISCTFLLTEQ